MTIAVGVGDTNSKVILMTTGICFDNIAITFRIKTSFLLTKSLKKSGQTVILRTAIDTPRNSLKNTDMKQRWFGFDFIEGKVSEFGMTFLKFTKPEYGKYLIDNGFTQKQLNKCNKKDLMKLCRSF